MKEDFFEDMNRIAKKTNFTFNVKQLEDFYNYMGILLDWNEKINLTAITEMKDIILKHFIDSLTVLKYINDGDKIIDVGTGAGFPGIPIAIMRPDTEITLLDSLNKRILFLNDVITKLKLKNVKTVHGRAEENGKNNNYREKYDIVVSRAVANMSTLSEYLIPFAKVNGKCICMKGSEINDELENAKFAIKELGGEISMVDSFKLPESDMERNIVILKKVEKTKNIYPRKPGTPAKEPLSKV